MIKDRGRLFAARILFPGAALIICAISFMATAGSSSAIQVRAEVDKELAHILSVVQVKPNPELTMEPTVGKGGLLTSPDRKDSAYILCVPLPTPEARNDARIASILSRTQDPDPSQFLRFAVRKS